MGEMADLFLSSQDDIDFYEECALQGYRVPSYALRMPTLDDISSVYTTRKASPAPQCRQPRVVPSGGWVDKNGEVHQISEMTDAYLNNLIDFLCNNPQLMKQNRHTFEQMIEERYQRRSNGKSDK